jgi:hypothetical protein
MLYIYMPTVTTLDIRLVILASNRPSVKIHDYC